MVLPDLSYSKARCMLTAAAAMKASRDLSAESMGDPDGSTSGMERELFTWWMSRSALDIDTAFCYGVIQGA